MTPEPDERREPPPIEMQPLHLQNVARHIGSALPGQAVDVGPVPQIPEHRCPNCDYILAGLTSRRCPECGEPFTLLEARLRGLELSDGIRQAMHGERLDQIKKYTGLFLHLASISLQNILAGNWAALSFRGALLLAFMVPLWLGVILLKNVRDWNWSQACWIAGVGAIIMGGILAVM